MDQDYTVSKGVQICIPKSFSLVISIIGIQTCNSCLMLGTQGLYVYTFEGGARGRGRYCKNHETAPSFRAIIPCRAGQRSYAELLRGKEGGQPGDEARDSYHKLLAPAPEYLYYSRYCTPSL